MNKTYILILIAIIVAACNATRTSTLTTTNHKATKDTLIIMSYNIENYFHCEDDTLKNDEAFTPEGNYHWNYYRMDEKADRIKKVILSSNGWNWPSVVGFCEIEGEKALDYLLSKSGLNKIYNGLCYPTPDKRGIAVAMLYDKAKVSIIESHPIYASVTDSSFFTRDILYAKMLFDADTFHVMVNHWPSKYGGATESIWKREHVASVARHFCDSIKSADIDAKIILLGDFNDTAEANALTEVLGARHADAPYINLSGDTEKSSYKYRGVWGTIDHIIVSPNICTPQRPQFIVCDLDFIREDDERYGGYKPLRTFIGMKYNNGYSDHFPVMVKIVR